jgi:hypothetical protein
MILALVLVVDGIDDNDGGNRGTCPLFDIPGDIILRCGDFVGNGGELISIVL